jgi:LPPG:FO 2-phospho-L-lactate transferase
MAPVVVLAGGTGGAKLARGMLDVVGSDVVVIANTGDDVEAHGGYVSPDPDLVTFWLADRVDERGWGLRGDTFRVMDALRALGEDVWFNLGDEDLAVCLARARRLAGGSSPTTVADELRQAFGVRARVLPMCDEPVRTWIRARGEWTDLQSWLIRGRAEAPVEDVEYRGADSAAPADAVVEALREARAVIVGPSNPVISIGPILAVAGDLVRGCAAPVVAVSPLVRGRSLKGPTEEFLRWAGQPLSSDGIAAL